MEIVLTPWQLIGMLFFGSFTIACGFYLGKFITNDTLGRMNHHRNIRFLARQKRDAASVGVPFIDENGRVIDENKNNDVSPKE